ncbi:MAG: hypothetical protein N3B12_06585 [Armatimonadetes bacterium]|nr:hypothetical protein [Armatimonadota bacterium]
MYMLSAVAVKQDPVQRTLERDVKKQMLLRQMIKRKSRLRRLARRLLIPIVLAVLLLYVALYAGVTSVSHKKSKLMDLYRQESIRHERLMVELIHFSSPRHVTAAAQRFGMVCATRYDYLSKPATVASANR